MASKSVVQPSCSGRVPISLANGHTGPPDTHIQRSSSSQKTQQAQQQHANSLQQGEQQAKQQHQQRCTSQHAKRSILSRFTGKSRISKGGSDTKCERTFDLSAALVCAHKTIDNHRAEATVLQDRILNYKRVNDKLQRELDELRSRERIREQVDQAQALQDRIAELEMKVKGLEGSVDALGG